MPCSSYLSRTALYLLFASPLIWGQTNSIADLPANGLVGTYYNNVTMSGSPALQRTDPALDFVWNRTPPGVGVNAENFSVVWTGYLIPAVTDRYTFRVFADDGVRFFVNGEKKFERWMDQEAYPNDVPSMQLQAGTAYSIRIEYYQRMGNSAFRLHWYGTSGGVGPVPTALLRTALAVPPPVSQPSGGLRGTYFSNINLTAPAALERVDSTVDFDWNALPPSTNFPRTNFSVRWSGTITPPISGNYAFNLPSDDGTRLYLDGIKIIDQWIDKTAYATWTPAMPLVGGKAYPITIEYYQKTGSAGIQLRWATPKDANVLVPASVLAPAAGNPVVTPPPPPPVGGSGTGLNGTYFSGVALSGQPVLQRLDAQVNFTWGTAAPNGNLSSDQFSVRWLGSLQAPTSGTYRLITRSDDGIRLNFDGKWVIANWTDHSPTENTSDAVTLVAGKRYPIQLEYYERGGNSVAQLMWQLPDGTKQAIPTAMLYPGAQALITPPFTGTIPTKAPDPVTITSNATQITVHWTAVTGATSYAVYRGTQPNVVTTGTPYMTLNSPSVQLVDTAVQANANYSYRVVAENPLGRGPASAEVTARLTQPPITLSEADRQMLRYLRQSSFGPNDVSFARVRQIGIAAHLEEQLATPPSDYPDSSIAKYGVEGLQEHFFRVTMVGQDQLRQRVAFALHNLLVVSAVEVDYGEAILNYYRLLQKHAFGNYKDLLVEMALNPAMGEYLDMVNNDKGDPAKGTMPNENFAREFLQLFTIGLQELDLGALPVMDANGKPKPTYTQADILELSRVFTGWTYDDGRTGAPTKFNYHETFKQPMEAVEARHDTGAKNFLGRQVAGGLQARADLENAINLIFAHPNVAPFISKQLIQHLVTSNPSPGYVRAVAAKFNDNGSGVKGDMKAVLRAILLHEEARSTNSTAGRLQEPVLYITAQLRALNADVTDQPFMADLAADMGQRVFYSPSVFNYFSPEYRIPGVGLTGGEFQLLSTTTATIRANFTARLLAGWFGSSVKINYQPWTSLASDPEALLNRLDQTILAGNLTAELRAAIAEAMAKTNSPDEKVKTALYLGIISGANQVEHSLTQSQITQKEENQLATPVVEVIE